MGWTSCSTGSAAGRRFAPSVRCALADGSSCTATTPLSRTGTSGRAWIGWYAATATLWLWSKLSPGRSACAYRIQKLRGDRSQVVPVGGRARALPVGGGPRDPEWFRADFQVLLELLREGRIRPVVADRLPLSEARRAHELLDSSAAKGKLVLVP
jgi:NADPH:quinone reductase